ncbi:response regulator transcription factor [Streptomyces sp. NPDC004284]|uniref:response regulator transcription factor n=1 Tax=Streptomyces sp. NPDC004284 TaxID=3364695 RepID=UPI0036CFBB12
MRLVAHGRTNEELAADLYVSLSTVKTHLGSVQRKPAARNRVEIAAWAWENGIMGTRRAGEDPSGPERRHGPMHACWSPGTRPRRYPVTPAAVFESPADRGRPGAPYICFSLRTHGTMKQSGASGRCVWETPYMCSMWKPGPGVSSDPCAQAPRPAPAVRRSPSARCRSTDPSGRSRTVPCRGAAHGRAAG